MSTERVPYRCSACGGVFERDPEKDAAAHQEALERFGKDGNSPDMAIVCEDCYRVLSAFYNARSVVVVSGLLRTRLPEEVRQRIREPQAPIRPAASPEEAERRAQLVERVRSARQEIAKIFDDCAYWNANIRKPDEEPIDPDPDGDLKALAEMYDAMLKRDTQ